MQKTEGDVNSIRLLKTTPAKQLNNIIKFILFIKNYALIFDSILSTNSLQTLFKINIFLDISQLELSILNIIL